MNGGKVVNLAVDLNGQPPIQVFAKFAIKPKIIMRSIDLGRELTVKTYEELQTYNLIGDAFSIPKAALCLCGFTSSSGFDSLEEQLKDFGGGIEITLLSVIPKGSGLGTSSILAAAILKTLSQMCSLGWDDYEVSRQTLVLEQMLTTGGGWQDQVGGIFQGLKLIETTSGFKQYPRIKWLSDTIFTNPEFKQNILLYYTGITRVAKNILAEIVTGMFVNSSKHLQTLDKIYANVENMYEALQLNKWDCVIDALNKSWQLNQKLDSGTNPPEVSEMIGTIQDDVAALKLLGAGGGGYILIFAKDTNSAMNIRRKLSKNRPNDNARFVDFSVSKIGSVVTKS